MKKAIIKVLNPKKEKPEWELLYESINPNIEKLIKLYGENPYHARVIFKQKSHSFEYVKNRVLAYTFANGDVNIVRFLNSYGMSITNRLYKSEKNVQSIIYKKDSGKWYIRKNGNICGLTYSAILSFIAESRSYGKDDKLILKFMEDKLPFLRNLAEDKYGLSHTLTIDTIIKNKLFNLKSMYRHIFKLPYPVILSILTHLPKGYDVVNFYKIWKEMSKCLFNIEGIRPEILRNEYFIDTCKFAGSLGYKVNCSWSDNRLKLEHDNWSKILSRIILSNEPLYALNISDIYIKFSNFSKYRLLRTNHELVHDGIDMHHCVGTYVNKVHNGNAGIFKLDGYTFELNVMDNKLFLVQLKGLANKEAPIALCEEIKRTIQDFNVIILPSITLEKRKPHSQVTVEGLMLEEVPF